MTTSAADKVKALMVEEPADVEVLDSQLEAYRTQVVEMKRTHQLLDASVANAIIDGYFVLLKEITHPLSCRTVEAGIRYLVEEEDDSYDLEVGGFDDDAEVFNYVCDICGRGDLKIDVTEFH